MRRQQERYKTFSRRALVLAGGKVVLLSALVARMYYLQVVNAKRYAVLADENRINMRLLAPPRGLVLDRTGVPLARNRQDYKLVMVAEQSPDIEKTISALAQILSLSADDRRRIRRELARVHPFVPITIREGLTWEEVSRVEVNAPDLPGVSITVGLSRYYPFGTEAAHVLGYVGAVSPSEMTDDPLLRLPDFRIGKNGVERTYEAALRGKAGAKQVEINARGRVIRELSRREAKAGREVVLTLDMELQHFVDRRLGDNSAAAVVLDVHEGQVLAMASMPSFDPNMFEKGIEAEQWRRLIRDPRAPLTNKAIAGQYAPGSTFKIIVALAALAAGVTPDHEVTCTGEMRLGDTVFHCWKRYGHGRLRFVEAIQQSCDIYFYDLALRTGIERIVRMARRFGFGQILNDDLPGERPGLLPTKAWKEKVMHQPWQQGETLITGIGQGYLLATPLQLAVMVARVANGGFAVAPRLVRQEGAEAEPAAARPFASLGVSSAGLAVVREGMNLVVNHPRGTAYRARIREDGMHMAGKTGTSQVRRISRSERAAGVRKNEDLPWAQRDHALFVAYAPVEAPRYAAAVVVEHGGSGSRAAAPIVRDILRETQRRDPLRIAPEGKSIPTADADGRKVG